MRGADVPEPRIVNGAGHIEPDGTVVTGPSSKVELACPPGTNVVVGTMSGSVECVGSLGKVTVSTASGKVRIERATEADVRTLSGTVEVGCCDGECRVVAASARVDIDQAADTHVTTKSGNVTVGSTHDARVRVASGKVRLATTGGGDVDVHCMSGRVEIEVPPGQVPTVRASTVSGRVVTPAGGGEADHGALTVKTLSGSIVVTEG